MRKFDLMKRLAIQITIVDTDTVIEEAKKRLLAKCDRADAAWGNVFPEVREAVNALPDLTLTETLPAPARDMIYETIYLANQERSSYPREGDSYPPVTHRFSKAVALLE